MRMTELRKPRAVATKSAPDARRADLAKIHLAIKELRWDESMYRDVLQTVCGVRSSGDLDATGRQRFLEHLQRCGWKPTGGAPFAKDRPVRMPLTWPQKKMWSLWQQLADAGLVKNRKMPALLAYVQRQTHVDRLEWLNGAQESLVIESLKAWLERKTPEEAA
jgi:phage gp16-like protein